MASHTVVHKHFHYLNTSPRHHLRHRQGYGHAVLAATAAPAPAPASAPQHLLKGGDTPMSINFIGFPVTLWLSATDGATTSKRFQIQQNAFLPFPTAWGTTYTIWPDETTALNYGTFTLNYWTTGWSSTDHYNITVTGSLTVTDCGAQSCGYQYPVPQGTMPYTIQFADSNQTHCAGCCPQIDGCGSG